MYIQYMYMLLYLQVNGILDCQLMEVALRNLSGETVAKLPSFARTIESRLPVVGEFHHHNNQKNPAQHPQYAYGAGRDTGKDTMGGTGTEGSADVNEKGQADGDADGNGNAKSMDAFNRSNSKLTARRRGDEGEKGEKWGKGEGTGDGTTATAGSLSLWASASAIRPMPGPADGGKGGDARGDREGGAWTVDVSVLKGKMKHRMNTSPDMWADRYATCSIGFVYICIHITRTICASTSTKSSEMRVYSMRLYCEVHCLMLYMHLR